MQYVLEFKKKLCVVLSAPLPLVILCSQRPLSTYPVLLSPWKIVWEGGGVRSFSGCVSQAGRVRPGLSFPVRARAMQAAATGSSSAKEKKVQSQVPSAVRMLVEGGWRESSPGPRCPAGLSLVVAVLCDPVLSHTVATSLTWSLSTWHVARGTEELNLSLYFILFNLNVSGHVGLVAVVLDGTPPVPAETFHG